MTTFKELILAAYNTKWHLQPDSQVLWNQMTGIVGPDLHREVTQQRIDQHILGLKARWPNPATARRVGNNYATMVAIAVRYDMLSDMKVDLPKVTMPRRQPIDRASIEVINTTFVHRTGDLAYRLLRDCGLRGLGVELRNLVWSDLNGGLLQVHSEKGGKHITRMVPVPAALSRMLEISRGKNSERICTTAELEGFRKIWNREVSPMFNGIVPYQLRHTYATRLLGKNVPPHVVQSIMGHADIKTTMTYAHITQDDIQLVRSSL